MRRFMILSLAVAVMLVSVGPGAVGQEATPAGMRAADHPIVGAWRWTNSPDDPVLYTYAIFHDDGTYVEVAGNSTGIGAWEPTGERTAEVGYFYQNIAPSPGGFEPGTVLIRATVEVAESGDSATATYGVEVQAPDDTVVFQADALEGALSRIAVGSLTFPEPPVAATPTS